MSLKVRDIKGLLINISNLALILNSHFSTTGYKNELGYNWFVFKLDIFNLLFETP